MKTLELNDKELAALIMALDSAIDFVDDSSTEALWTEDNVVSFSTLKEMRQQVNSKIDELVCLVRLSERAKSLK